LHSSDGPGGPRLVRIGHTARPGGQHDTQERAAKKACLVGDVEKEVDILADLYVSTNNPTYLYNQGRCDEQNGKNDLAILRFKEYLRKANGLPAADEAAVRKKIDELAAASAGTANGQASAPAAQPAPSPTAMSYA